MTLYLNIMLLDCHTHRPAPYPEGIVSVTPGEWNPLENQLYSVGLHPWSLPSELHPALEQVRELAMLPQVVAIGETGLDSVKGEPMFRQLQSFKAHALLAEEVRKPLIVHNVRCAQEICQLRHGWKASVPWVIHGFRGKASVLKMLLDAGCHISTGERFNAAVLPLVSPGRLLVETDESRLPVGRIVEMMAGVLGMSQEKLTELIVENLQTILI